MQDINPSEVILDLVSSQVDVETNGIDYSKSDDHKVLLLIIMLFKRIPHMRDIELVVLKGHHYILFSSPFTHFGIWSK